MGEGLALRWSPFHEIIVGSRKLDKARDAVRKYTDKLDKAGRDYQIFGLENRDAAKISDVVVLSIPYKHVISTVNDICDSFDDQIVISPVTAMKREGDHFVYAPSKKSCVALEIKEILPETVKLISAFHTLPAKGLADVSNPVGGDVIICGDDDEAKKTVFSLTKLINNLRSLDGGPLSASYMAESLVPMLINLAIRNKLGDLSIKFV